MKSVESLTVEDVSANPVWEYVGDEDDMAVRPVQALPVRSLSNRLVGTRVRLANGTSVWAILSNVHAKDPKATEHFLHLSVERDGKWFNLARYHDHYYREQGPRTLAQFLDLQVKDVFPIEYDVTPYVMGDAAALKGSVLEKPRKRLSSKELMDLVMSVAKPEPE